MCACPVSSTSALVIKLIDFLIVSLHSERDEPCDLARQEWEMEKNRFFSSFSINNRHRRRRREKKKVKEGEKD